MHVSPLPALGLVVALFAAPGLADTLGEPGRMLSFRVLASESDDFALLRGEIYLASGKTLQAYKWGGSFCPGLDLSEAQEARLQAGLGERKLLLIPYFKNGQGGARCLVQFILTDKKSAEAVSQPFF